jgi:hypothetical protein
MVQKDEVQPLQIDIQQDDKEVTKTSSNNSSSISHIPLIICATISFLFIGYFILSGADQR